MITVSRKISKNPILLPLTRPLSSPPKKPKQNPKLLTPKAISAYLTSALSFPKPDADLISSKLSPRFSSASDPVAVVSFLRSSAHLDPAQLRRFLRVRPSLLLSSVDSTLSPKLSVILSLFPDGSAPESVAALVSASASAFGYSASRLGRLLSLLRSLLLDDDRKVVNAIRRYPRLLTNDPDKTLARNADLLRSRGLSDPARLAKFIDRSPLVLFISPHRLASAFDIVSREFDINVSDYETADECANAVNLAAALTAEGFMSRIATLKKFGFEKEELLLLFRRCPSFMRLKEDYMVKKLEFFRDKVGVGPQEMLRNAWVLMLSLETRLMPRYELMKGLKERGLDLPEGSMCKAFAMNDLKFENLFVNKFKDGEGSDLVDIYRRSLVAAKKVETPSSESSSE